MTSGKTICWFHSGFTVSNMQVVASSRLPTRRVAKGLVVLCKWRSGRSARGEAAAGGRSWGRGKPGGGGGGGWRLTVDCRTAGKLHER